MIRRREFLLLAPALGARSANQPAAQRTVAITIDDLPRGGDWPKSSTPTELLKLNRDFLAPCRRSKIPLTGFVNAGRAGLAPPQLNQLLRLWLLAGAELGNHTHTHPDLNNTPLQTYVADIVECHRALARVTKPRYFRHPFLNAGPDKTKRQGLERFLAAQRLSGSAGHSRQLRLHVRRTLRPCGSQARPNCRVTDSRRLFALSRFDLCVF